MVVRIVFLGQRVGRWGRWAGWEDEPVRVAAKRVVAGSESARRTELYGIYGSSHIHIPHADNARVDFAIGQPVGKECERVQRRTCDFICSNPLPFCLSVTVSKFEQDIVVVVDDVLLRSNPTTCHTHEVTFRENRRIDMV